MATEEMEVMDFEDDLVTSSSNKFSKFDATMGHVEDIIMEDEFQRLQQEFMEKYYLEFEDTEENKFAYTDIHKEYFRWTTIELFTKHIYVASLSSLLETLSTPVQTELIEKYLEQQLLLRMPEFSMEEFSKELVVRKEELDGEVFEILMTFTDFLAFKEMLLDYRAEKEGRTVDLSDALTVMSVSSSGLSLQPSLVGLSSGDSLSSDPDPDPACH